MIPNETPRGRIPPPWFDSLSGVDRARLFSQGGILMVPVARLFGVRITHVAPGGVTAVTPATETSLKNAGHMNILPPLVSALETAAMTALSPGSVIVPLKIVVDSFRPAHPQPGNFIARARVLNSSRPLRGTKPVNP